MESCWIALRMQVLGPSAHGKHLSPLSPRPSQAAGRPCRLSAALHPCLRPVLTLCPGRWPSGKAKGRTPNLAEVQRGIEMRVDMRAGLTHLTVAEHPWVCGHGGQAWKGNCKPESRAPTVGHGREKTAPRGPALVSTDSVHLPSGPGRTQHAHLILGPGLTERTAHGRVTSR